jgi:voltage-gated sodium channel
MTKEEERGPLVAGRLCLLGASAAGAHSLLVYSSYSASNARMNDENYERLLKSGSASPFRLRLAGVVDSQAVQMFITAVIILNAAILGLQTDRELFARFGSVLVALDHLCLTIFVIELFLKLLAYRGLFWKSGWNWFDFIVVAIALVPGIGPWAVLRSLRVLRVLRLFTMVPQLRRVVAAALHAIPGLASVLVVMAVFFYTAAVLATTLFGGTHPAWFGSLGASLYTLFQVMTLESWSMGIVRPVMESHPMAWLFFVPFIIVATFTILNLFIGIIVSTMQELSTVPDLHIPPHELSIIIDQLETNLKDLRSHVHQGNGRTASAENA